MKTFIAILSTFILIGLTSCHTESIPQNDSAPIANIYSRGESQAATIEAGSQALLNVRGMLDIDNEIFTFDGKSWKNTTEFKWSDTEATTYMTAICPVYADKAYTTENLYSNDKLEDVLIAKDTLSSKADINLQFKHQFSSLAVTIESTLLQKIERIEVTTPYKVSGISPITGEITKISENHTTVIQTDGSETYTVILPPAENCVLSLSITMSNEEIITKSLTAHTFESGVSYECNLRGIGIFNANDLIDFCQLINGTYKGSKTKYDFGKEIDGKMVYSLLRDITLTEEDCAKLSPIGPSSSKTFNDIFDGKGFTISNLILPDVDYTGLFGYIGESGIVKNLHINNASMKGVTQSKHVGIIASKNSGLIDGCSVSNSKLNTVTAGRPGIISSLSPGYITNSYTKNNTITVKSSSYGGGITSELNGHIVNCYTYNNNFLPKSNDSHIGSIAGSCFGNNTHINNCYIYHSQTTSRWGAAVGNLIKCTIKNFYYNKESLYSSKSGTLTKENTKKYDESSFKVNDTHISTLLDNWVTDPNRTTYSGYTFKRWKIADDGSACFQ